MKNLVAYPLKLKKKPSVKKVKIKKSLPQTQTVPDLNTFSKTFQVQWKHTLPRLPEFYHHNSGFLKETHHIGETSSVLNWRSLRVECNGLKDHQYQREHA